MKTEYKETPVVEKKILFDSEAENTIYFIAESKGKSYRVGHTFLPVSDERYFKFASEVLASAKKVFKRNGVETNDFLPAENLWDDLCISRIGYVEKANWKEKVKLFEKIDTVKTLLFTDIVETETDESSELLDDSETQVIIRLDVYQNGAMISTEHYLNEASKAQIDEFFNIQNKRPSKNVLVSGKPKTPEERYCDLYNALIDTTIGYKTTVPAWHKEKVIDAFFAKSVEVGKSSLALKS